MATTDDIDTKAAVRKFLETRAVSDREDPSADSADEIQSVLESVALSFLLFPQAALSFVLRAKNVLQQIATTDRDILDFMIKTIDDVDNPDEPVADLSDLIEAQTALVEVDRLGRVADDVRAYDRYTQAINRFLDKRLAKSLKRHHRGELERTGTEAKQDLFRVLSVFGPTHSLMVSKLGLLLDGVSNFQSVSLTKIVSTKTLTKVRSSLKKVLQNMQRQQLSKTAASIELLAGASALSSISNTRKIYDPTVDTGTYPAGKTITVRSERVPAVATGTAASTSLSAVATPWVFTVTVDGVLVSTTLPASGASGRCYVKASTGAATYNIPVGTATLYVQFDGIAPASGEPVRVRSVALPTGGAVTLAAILSALNHVTTGLIDGTAVEMAPGTGRILIYGSASVTGITIRDDFHGDFDGSGNYVPLNGSVHRILGFSDQLKSTTPTSFAPAELVDLVAPRLTNADISLNDDGAIEVTSDSSELSASISFGGVASNFGFSGTYLPSPTYLEFVEDDEVADPESLGIYVDSMVTANDVDNLASKNLFSAITSISDMKVYFATGVSLPRCDGASVRVVSPLVYSVQSLYDSVRPLRDVWESDARDLQRVLSPILSRPTLAQVNDAKRVLQAIRDRVDDLIDRLSSTVVRTDRAQFWSVALQITSSLTERGLDRALELLEACQFAEFFALTNEEASKGSRFLKASEEVGRNDLLRTTIEQDQDDSEPTGTTPDQNLLPGEELLEDEEQL